MHSARGRGRAHRVPPYKGVYRCLLYLPASLPACLPQPLTYADSHLKRARDIRRLWQATPSPSPPHCYFSCSAFSSFSQQSQLGSHIWIMPVKWRRHCWAFILSGFDAPTSATPRHARTHLATSCLWLTGCDWRCDGFILNSFIALPALLSVSQRCAWQLLNVLIKCKV